MERERLLLAKRIASKANPRIKDWASLADRKERRRLGLTLAEGAKLAAEGLAAGAASLLKPAALILSDSGAERPEADSLFEKAGELGLERFSLSDECFAKISSLKHDEGIALALSFADEAVDLAALWRGEGARWLVAACVQDPGNAGALARTALAAGCDGCVFVEGADPLGPKFLRGGMGAAFRLPCVAAGLEEFVDAWPRIAASGARLIVASAAEGADFRRAAYAGKWALVVGGEKGVPEAFAALPSEKRTALKFRERPLTAFLFARKVTDCGHPGERRLLWRTMIFST